MTIDISKGVYLTTKEIIDYAEKHNLDATDVWSQAIQKFVDLGADEYEGRGGSRLEYSDDWKGWKYTGVCEGESTTYHDNLSGYFGDTPVQITINQLITSETVKEDTPFQLEVGRIYECGGEGYIKIINTVEGINEYPFIGIRCTIEGDPFAYIGLYRIDGKPESDNVMECQLYLKPITEEHPNIAKIKELEEQINKLKEEMK